MSNWGYFTQRKGIISPFITGRGQTCMVFVCLRQDFMVSRDHPFLSATQCTVLATSTKTLRKRRVCELPFKESLHERIPQRFLSCIIHRIHWEWYIYLQLLDFHAKHVGRCTRLMDLIRVLLYIQFFVASSRFQIGTCVFWTTHIRLFFVSSPSHLRCLTSGS